MAIESLQEEMNRSGLTAAEVATMCGVSPRTVFNWLNGTSPVPQLALNAVIAEGFSRADAALEPVIGTQTESQRRELLEFVAAQQRDKIAYLESELEAAKQELEETIRQL